jgi:hypothetical protein
LSDHAFEFATALSADVGIARNNAPQLKFNAGIMCCGAAFR